MPMGSPAGKRIRPDADDPAIRTCLKCGKPFESLGRWNRICRKCNDANRAVYTITGRVAISPVKTAR